VAEPLRYDQGWTYDDPRLTYDGFAPTQGNRKMNSDRRNYNFPDALLRQDFGSAVRKRLPTFQSLEPLISLKSSPCTQRNHDVAPRRRHNFRHNQVIFQRRNPIPERRELTPDAETASRNAGIQSLNARNATPNAEMASHDKEMPSPDVEVISPNAEEASLTTELASPTAEHLSPTAEIPSRNVEISSRHAGNSTQQEITSIHTPKRAGP
jgi:hypothetical protein